jgi:TonB family protein
MRSLVLSIPRAFAIAALAVTPALGQATVCDSPCKILKLPLIVPNDKPVPNSNPLAELQGKIGTQNSQQVHAAHVYSASEVDQAARRILNGADPQYPDAMLNAHMSGSVEASFVVGVDGIADSASLKISGSSSDLLSNAVREVLPRMRFVPAELDGSRVRQLMEHTFTFDFANAMQCSTACPFMLLPLIVPQGHTYQKKLPFVPERFDERSQTYFSYQVDQPAVQRPGSIMPQYPDSLKRAKVAGEVDVAFVVDTTGHADIETIQVVKWTQQLFVVAVLDALPKMEFVPAELHGLKVRQLVQMPFVFNQK